MLLRWVVVVNMKILFRVFIPHPIKLELSDVCWVCISLHFLIFMFLSNAKTQILHNCKSNSYLQQLCWWPAMMWHRLDLPSILWDSYLASQSLKRNYKFLVSHLREWLSIPDKIKWTYISPDISSSLNTITVSNSKNL